MGRYSSVTLTDNSGNALASRSTIAHEEDNRSLMGGLNGSFQSGPVSHRLNFGLAGIWTQARNAYVFNASSTATRTNIYDPVTGAPPTLNNPRNTPGTDFSDPTITGKTFVRSAAVSDTLGFFDDRLLVTLGARRQQMVVQAYNYMSGTRTSNYDESITTPVYGLVFKPWQHVSFYANRIEGLAQGPTSPVNSGNRTIIGGGQAFAPARSRQIEAGVKVDMGTYGATLGVYRIEQPGAGYVQVIDATTARYVREGQQINKGVELNVFGEPLSGLRLLGGVTVMKTELKDTQNGANDGNRAIGVPSFQLNADVDWDVPGLQGVTLNGRWLRTGGQYADAANNLSLPTWNRFDMGARYNFQVAQRDVTLGATVENVANARYWESAQGGFLSQGDPRVAKLSATVDF